MRVEWLQIGIRRPVFTPPLWTSTVHRRLRRWNRDKPWFYPTFFRRLRRWVSERGDAAWDSRCCDVGCAHRYVGKDRGVGQRAAFPFSEKQSGRCRWQRPLHVYYWIALSLPGAGFVVCNQSQSDTKVLFDSFSFKKKNQGFWRRGAARISSLRSRRSSLSRAAKRASSPMRSMAAPRRSF